MPKQSHSSTEPKTLDASAAITVVFICLGNICRSPLAAAIFTAYARQHASHRSFRVLSAATGKHTIGESADQRSIQTARKKALPSLPGVCDQLESHVAQTVSQDMLLHADYVLVMDQENHANVMKKWRAALLAQPGLAQRPMEDRLFYFGNFTLTNNQNGGTGRQKNVMIKDPWDGSMQDFENVYDQCLAASKGLLDTILCHDAK